MNRNNRFPIFFAPDKGGEGAAGGASEPSKEGEGTLFQGVDLSNLDDASRAALGKIESHFATLQQEITKKDELARSFQSRADRVEAELSRVKGAVAGDRPQQLTAEQEVEQLMIANGVNPTAAKAQAPVMTKLLQAQEKNIMARVGAGVAPVANMILANDAEKAFNYVKATDPTGALMIPEVAQQVWNSCQEIIKDGTAVTADTIKNLRAMHYMAHAEKDPAVFATLQMNRTSTPTPLPINPGGRIPVSVNTGGYSYPGASFSPNINAPADPNAPRTSLDAGTKAALQSVFSIMKPGHKI